MLNLESSFNVSTSYVCVQLYVRKILMNSTFFCLRYAFLPNNNFCFFFRCPCFTMALRDLKFCTMVASLLKKNLITEQARQILNENELGTLDYYLEEYSQGYITVSAFALALFDLLNTPAKVCFVFLCSCSRCIPSHSCNHAFAVQIYRRFKKGEFRSIP